MRLRISNRSALDKERGHPRRGRSCKHKDEATSAIPPSLKGRFLSVNDLLPAAREPTLLLYGDREVRSPVSVGEALQAKVPQSTLVVIPGFGHVSNFDAPGRFNAEVRRFLRSSQL
jgi:pimeloyl-ACP methyl ester carboxylesterase